MFVGISFDNTTGMFLLKVRNSFGEDRKKLWNLLFRKLLAIFFLLDTYNTDLATLLNTFYRNAENPLKLLYQKFSLDSRNTVLTNLPKTSGTETPIFSPRKSQKLLIFCVKKFFFCVKETARYVDCTFDETAIILPLNVCKVF